MFIIVLDIFFISVVIITCDIALQDIISVDPCHKFTWCLDACIREKNVDIKRSRELQVGTATKLQIKTSLQTLFMYYALPVRCKKVVLCDLSN